MFWQLHFHWALDNAVGSEHQIDGKHYPLEVMILQQLGARTSQMVRPDGPAAAGPSGRRWPGPIHNWYSICSDIHVAWPHETL